MAIIEVDGLVKTFKTRERGEGLAASMQSFVAPRYRTREAVKHISFSLVSWRGGGLHRAKWCREVNHN